MKCKYVKVCIISLFWPHQGQLKGFLVLGENFLGLKDVDFLTVFEK